MAIQFFLSDDVTSASSLAFSANAGDTTAATILHVWYNKGTNGGSLTEVRFGVECENPALPGTYLVNGIPALDEHWFEARINGGNNAAADGSFVQTTSDWFKLGTNVSLPCDNLPGNTARFIEVRFHPPLKDGVVTESVNFRIVAQYTDSAFSISRGLAEEGQGFLTGVGDKGVREFVEAPSVTASGAPDAFVHVGKRWYVYDGLSLRSPNTDDLVLNQSDSGPTALAAGQEYKAVISQPKGNGVTSVASVVTKGVLAATGTSVAPAVPAGNLPIAIVTVAYQGGGTSISTRRSIARPSARSASMIVRPGPQQVITAPAVPAGQLPIAMVTVGYQGGSIITQGNINVTAVNGRGKPTIGTGLTVNVAPFRAIISSVLMRTTSQQVVTVGASTTSWIWLTSSGTFAVTTTNAPPFIGALPICNAVSGVSTVTSITDLRSFFEPGVKVFQVKLSGAEAPTFYFRNRVKRERVTIAAAAFTDSNILTPVGMRVIAVSTYIVTVPPTCATMDVGLAGDTQRFDIATSTTAVGNLSQGTRDGARYYTTGQKIRLTPNVTPAAATGVVDVMVFYEEVALANALDRAGIPFDWNLDRIVAQVSSAATGTGSTVFRPTRSSDGADLCAVAFAPTIAVNATADPNGYPVITTGLAGDSLGFGLQTWSSTTGATDLGARDLFLTFYLYPLAKP